MTDADLDRLAELIARALLERGDASAPASRATWLPVPVRPGPPERVAEPPIWSGAAQDLGDVAPTRVRQDPPRFRASTAEMARATRAAAAGKGPPPDRARREPERRLTRQRAAGAPSIDVRIGVSNRHVHLSTSDVQTLFGSASLTPARQLTQPGQFAANESIAVQGPKGRLEGIRIVGPARGETQLEIAASLLHDIRAPEPLVPRDDGMQRAVCHCIRARRTAHIATDRPCHRLVRLPSGGERHRRLCHRGLPATGGERRALAARPRQRASG